MKRTVYEIKNVHRRTVTITFSDEADAVKPYAVQYCGAGHYFRDAYGALCFCQGRGFIEYTAVEEIEKKILRTVGRQHPANMAQCTILKKNIM